MFNYANLKAEIRLDCLMQIPVKGDLLDAI